MRSLAVIVGQRSPSRLIDSADGWWVAKQRSGTTLLDQSGGGNNLTGSGTPTFSDDGAHHYASLRVASTQYFTSSGDVALFDPQTGDFTVVMVTKPQVVLSGARILASKRSGGDLGWNLYTQAAVLSATLDDDTAAPVVPTGGSLSVGTRSTVALVISGTSAFVVKDGTAGSSVTRPTNSINSPSPLRVSGTATAAALSDQDVYGLAIFKGVALSAADTATVGAELLAADTV